MTSRCYIWPFPWQQMCWPDASHAGTNRCHWRANEKLVSHKLMTTVSVICQSSNKLQHTLNIGGMRERTEIHTKHHTDTHTHTHKKEQIWCLKCVTGKWVNGQRFWGVMATKIYTSTFWIMTFCNTITVAVSNKPTASVCRMKGSNRDILGKNGTSSVDSKSEGIKPKQLIFFSHSTNLQTSLKLPVGFF
jgi:hypothetical protein